MIQQLQKFRLSYVQVCNFNIKTIFKFFLFLLFTSSSTQFTRAQIKAEWAAAGKGIHNHEGRLIDIDNSGNVYSFGYYTQNIDFGNGNTLNQGGSFIAKYDLNGAILWAKDFAETGASEMAVDTQTGAIYLVGSFNNATLDFGNGVVISNMGNKDMFLVKLNTNGIAQWAQALGGAGEDVGVDVEVGINGDIYFMGNFKSNAIQLPNSYIIIHSNSTTEDIVQLKYDSNGNILWFDSANSKGIDLVIGSSDFVYTSEQRSPGNSVLRKRNSLGNIVNVISENPGELTADSEGNVYLEYNQQFKKFDKYLNNVWSSIPMTEYQSLATGFGTRSMEVDSYGNLIVMGGFISDSLNLGNGVIVRGDVPKVGLKSDTFIASYSPYGVAKWAYVINKDGEECDGLNFVIDPSNKLHITGKYRNTSLDFGNNVTLPTSVEFDVFTSKLNLPHYYNFGNLIFKKYLKIVCKDCLLNSIYIKDIMGMQMNLRQEEDVKRKANEYPLQEVKFWGEEEDIYIQLPKKLQPGEYSVKIRALLNDGTYTKWSETLDFELEGKTAEKLLTVYPNPFVKDVNLSYQSQNNDEVTVELTDAHSGKLLLKEHFEAYEGENEWQLAVPYAPSEIVILKLYSTTQKPIMKKLMRGR